jgi:hypothetical protein
MAECLKNDCLREIAEFTEFTDNLSNSQHECKFHKEVKEACDEFTRLRNEIGGREKSLSRACECKKLEKAGV